MIILLLNTALRISDVLEITWGDVYDSISEEYRTHLRLIEKKTNKKSVVKLNKELLKQIKCYRSYLIENGRDATDETYLFSHKNKNMALSRMQAHRIIKKAATECEIPGIISCHSLRKTLGYTAWKNGISPVLLVDIYNHSSYRVTKRYLGIEQDERDEVFDSIIL